MFFQETFKKNFICKFAEASLQQSSKNFDQALSIDRRCYGCKQGDDHEQNQSK
jgi:hypothetical protein